MKGNLINLIEGIDEMPTLTRGQLLTESICVLFPTESIRKPRPSHYQLQIGTCHRCLPSSSTRIMCHCSCWPSIPPERSSVWRSEMMCPVLKEKLAGQLFKRYLQKPILWAQFLHLLHDNICSSWLAETFYKKYVLDCLYSLFTKITYILNSPATSLEQFLGAI